MILKTVLMTAAVALTLTGCATSRQVEDTNKNLAAVTVSVRQLSTQLAMTQAQAAANAKQAPEAACYLAGERYSPGSVVAGRICGFHKELVDDRLADQWGWAPNLR
jgi:murein lipoprotein